MQETLNLEQLSELRGSDVYSQDGEKIGSVDEVFYDEQTRRPEWIGLGTGFFGTKRVLVPAEGALIGPEGVTVPYAREQVKDAPDVDSGEEISQEAERELYSYYGLGYSERRSETGLPEGEGHAGPEDLAETGAPAGEASVTRSEEELQVGTQREEAGRARLRKWVETEPVQMGVDLQRETARVRRDTIDEPVGEGEIGEQEVEVSLERERPVVTKETVAKERVSLEKDVERERETVADEVRKERVEVEGDDVERA